MPYDGPIYVGQRAEPPDKVIAEVQAVLQEMGYYTGEVDGLLGPLTREALAAYQADQGLMTTAAIDRADAPIPSGWDKKKLEGWRVRLRQPPGRT